jgi:DNA-binding LacI/PurR family transcriptional regulator
MSIADVAKTAGVSRATVSRVINNRRGVAPEIVKAVKEAMVELHYTPPPLERRPGRRVPLGSKGVSCIGVVLLDELYRHTPGVFAAHLSGMEQEAAEQGLGMVVMHATAGGKLPPAIVNRQVEGLILMGSKAAPGVLDALSGFTSVWLSSHRSPTGDTVVAGNQQISRMAVDYLLKRGHRQLGFLSVMSSYPAYPARAEAFRFFAFEAGASAAVFMDNVPASEELGAEDLAALQRRIDMLAEEFASATPRPTGLFVPNDMMTAMCYVALRRRGVQPGRDVELISCNNEISYLIGLDPRPATIDIGADVMGRRCVEALLRKMRYPNETRPVEIAVSPVLIEANAGKRWR